MSKGDLYYFRFISFTPSRLAEDSLSTILLLVLFSSIIFISLSPIVLTLFPFPFPSLFHSFRRRFHGKESSPLEAIRELG